MIHVQCSVRHARGMRQVPRRADTLPHKAVWLVGDWLFGVNRQWFELVADAHFLPVVIKFLATIEANDVGSPACPFLAAGVAGGGNREGCPAMRATQKDFKERIHHRPFIHLN